MTGVGARRGAASSRSTATGCRSTDATPVVTLREGGTPLVPAPATCPSRTGCEVYLKVEGANPTGSFKDRGMTMAITKAVEEGAKAVICASTGNTSASAAAYAARAGLTCAVLVPDGQDRAGQAGPGAGARRAAAAGRRQLRRLPRRWPASSPTTTRSRWSTRVNPDRIEGQKTAAFEVVRRARRRARRALPAGRQRRQHHRLLEGLPRVRTRTG